MRERLFAPGISLLPPILRRTRSALSQNVLDMFHHTCPPPHAKNSTCRERELYIQAENLLATSLYALTTAGTGLCCCDRHISHMHEIGHEITCTHMRADHIDLDTKNSARNLLHGVVTGDTGCAPKSPPCLCSWPLSVTDRAAALADPLFLHAATELQILREFISSCAPIECYLCHTHLAPWRGIACAEDQKHFVCNPCFQQHVEQQCSHDTRQAIRGLVERKADITCAWPTCNIPFAEKVGLRSRHVLFLLDTGPCTLCAARVMCES
jgi:hypothetical protein